MAGEFRRLGETEIYRGHVISVGVGQFSAPDGATFDRDVVHHPGAVSVVALDADGEVVLVRQYRAAIDGDLLELPAGKRDVADEPPVVTAERELAEEVGLVAASFELLGEFFNSPGFCDEHSWVFLARGLREVPHDRQGIEEQHLTIERVPLQDVPARIAAGDITDAKTIIGLLLTRERLGS